MPMQEARVRSLGGEDPLENKMTTYSNTLAWKISRKEEPGELQSTGLQKNQTQLIDLTIYDDGCPVTNICH